MAKIPATATILTRNSAGTLPRCLSSVADFDEVLVLDGGSTDGTVEIAKKYDARVVSQGTAGPIDDFTAVRKQSFALARHDWVFVIDSDEYLDPVLADAIRHAVAVNLPDRAYRIERRVIIAGRKIGHACFYPDRILRLVRKESGVAWRAGKKVHEHFDVPPGTVVEDLPGVLWTEWPDFSALRAKDAYYLTLAFSKPKARRPARAATAVLINLVRAGRMGLKIFWLHVRYPRDVLPLRYHLRFPRYHLRIAALRVKQIFS